MNIPPRPPEASSMVQVLVADRSGRSCSDFFFPETGGRVEATGRLASSNFIRNDNRGPSFFCTVAVGIAHMSDLEEILGRVGRPRRCCTSKVVFDVRPRHRPGGGPM